MKLESSIYTTLKAFEIAVYKVIALLFIVLSIGYTNEAFGQDAEGTNVRIENGEISGVLLDKQSNLIVYRGIPYAAPPVGELRWTPPQPASNWEGIRPCDEFGAACPQKLGENGTQKLSEDCLYLNVWTNNINGKSKLPVMVWIHGGGLTSSWAHKDMYDGSEFAKNGVVLVSINYRLGPFGFLAHPVLSSWTVTGVSGNYGFLDQIAALEWVKRNIATFGGDPENVTIFGESAGATSVSVLCSSPMAKGTFHKAILQSPWMFGYINKLAVPNISNLKEPMANIPSAEELGLKWAKTYVKGRDKDALDQLKAMDAMEFIDGAPYYKARATIDGLLLSDRPEDIFMKGDQANVPMIIGTTRDEGNFFRGYISAITHEEFTDQLTDFYQNEAQTVTGMYPAVSEKEVKQAGSQYVSDAWFLQPTRQMLEGMKKVSSPAYQYEFTQINRKYPGLGAHHAVELRYVFNTLDPETATDEDQKLAQALMNYWIQFARTGNPNAAGLPNWPEYNTSKKEYLELGQEIKPGLGLRDSYCTTLDKINSNIYK